MIYGGMMRILYFLIKSAAAALLAAGLCVAQQPADPYCPFLPATPATPGHPHPQPRPPASEVSLTQENGITVAHITTAHGCFAESNPYQNPPGTNFLPTIYTNAFDGSGREMPNTLPSKPDVPYNLQDGKPIEVETGIMFGGGQQLPPVRSTKVQVAD